MSKVENLIKLYYETKIELIIELNKMYEEQFGMESTLSIEEKIKRLGLNGNI